MPFTRSAPLLRRLRLRTRAARRALQFTARLRPEHLPPAIGRVPTLPGLPTTAPRLLHTPRGIYRDAVGKPTTAPVALAYGCDALRTLLMVTTFVDVPRRRTRRTGRSGSALPAFDDACADTCRLCVTLPGTYRCTLPFRPIRATAFAHHPMDIVAHPLPVVVGLIPLCSLVVLITVDVYSGQLPLVRL